jgi:transcription initiation factor TFIIIB Brf1 subunit/transcription initiation factor TFIIB
MSFAPLQDHDPTETTGTELDDRAKQILDFEREWWRYAGAKEQAVREAFDLSPTRYYQLLNRVIDDERAVTYDPMLVKRLRRLRSARQRQRAAKRLGADAR